MLPIGHPARVPPVVLFAMAKARPIQPTNIHMAHCVRKRALYCDLDSGGGGGSVLARSGVFLKLTPEQYGRLRSIQTHGRVTRLWKIYIMSRE
jgi:hypothetical protein